LFRDFNGRAYFYAATATNANRVLWTTDGTTAGTVPVTDSSGTPVTGTLVPFKGGVYVVGLNFIVRISPTNPSRVESVGTMSTVPTRTEGARALNGAIYFLAGENTHGYELWKSDGTGAGTALVKDIYPGTVGTITNSSNPAGFSAAGNWVVFSAFDGVHGYELWRTDGTAAGTTLVKDINPGTGIGYQSSITNPAPISFNGLTYFMANDGVHGIELWRTDGTPDGTVMVADINAGAGTSSPADLTISGGKLYFTADDGGASGRELWVVDDQSAAGVRRVADVYPGAGSSNPMNLTDVEGALFFTANDGVHGPRLFKLDEVAPTLTSVPRYDFQGTSQAVVLEFSEDVSATLTAANMKLENRSSGQVVDPGLVRVEYDAATNRAKITVAGGMADGYYRLTSEATTDAGGNALAGGLSFDFAVMAGDADGNHAVDFNDLVVLAQHYNTVGGMTFGQGDFNYDGNVDFNDLVILAQRYNTTLAVPVGVVAGAGALATVAPATTTNLSPTGWEDVPGKKKVKTPVAKVFHAAPVVRPPAVKKVAASPFAKVRVR
jgi:ELWxxDGT repeat protein